MASQRGSPPAHRRPPWRGCPGTPRAPRPTTRTWTSGTRRTRAITTTTAILSSPRCAVRFGWHHRSCVRPRQAVVAQADPQWAAQYGPKVWLIFSSLTFSISSYLMSASVVSSLVLKPGVVAGLGTPRHPMGFIPSNSKGKLEFALSVDGFNMPHPTPIFESTSTILPQNGTVQRI